MTDFLYRLADRSLTRGPVAAPLIGPIFGPGLNVSPAVHTPVEHGDLETEANGAANSKGTSRPDATFDAPPVTEREASFHAMYQYDAPGKPGNIERKSFDAQNTTGGFEFPRDERVTLSTHLGSTAQLDQGHDIRIREERSDESETSPLLVLAPPRSRPEHIEAEPSTVISIREASRSDETLDRDRPVFVDHPTVRADHSTDYSKSAGQKGPPPISSLHSRAHRDQGKDIRMDERRSADGQETSRALAPETHSWGVEPDRTSVGSTVVSTRERNGPRQTLISDAPLNKAEDSTIGLRTPATRALPLASALEQTPQPYQENLVRDASQPEATVNRPAMETSRLASQPSVVRKNGESALLHSTLTANPRDETKSNITTRPPNLAESIRPPAISALTTRAPNISESIRPPAISALTTRTPNISESIRPPAIQALTTRAPNVSESILPSAISTLPKYGSSTPPTETVVAGEPARPIVVSPRIVSAQPTHEPYSTGYPSVKPVAEQIPVRREDAASPAPTIRVTIGRIDIRAATPPPLSPVQETAPPAPRMSLDDYLKAGNGGRP